MNSNNNVNLSLQLIPINNADAYPIIDEAIYAIQRSGVKYEVQPFATLMEGPLPDLLKVVEQAKEAALSAGAEELVLNIQIHLKKEQDVALEEKTKKFK
ncbi:MAG: thiamine-binding protein [Saprospiraceae bacterium]|nr:thiamine-binding protein [Lewinella sp.]